MRRAFFAQKGSPFAFAFLALFLSFASLPLFGAQLSDRAASALSSVFQKTQGAEMNAELARALASLSSNQERQELLAAFADYEEREGLFESAAAHYAQAAETGGAGGAEYFSLYLDAARCYMYMNEAEKANALIEKTLLNCFDSGQLFRARFYSACIRLSDEDFEGALEQIRLYLSIEDFAPYFPQMLFILWHAAGDTEAGSRLVALYPSSAEAAIVRGEASVLPRAFWYFMPTGKGLRSIAAENAADPVAAGIWQQTGFFRSRANAEAQAQELSKAGFRVFIRQENRAGGEVYFSVLIPEDEAGNTAIRLKERGFESYLVIDE